MFDQMDTQYVFSMDSNNANGLATAQNNCSFTQNGVFDMENCIIPRPLSMSVDEKMLKALSLFIASSGGGILAQGWVPMRLGDQHILSTCNPICLMKCLQGIVKFQDRLFSLLKGDQVHSLGFLGVCLSLKFQSGLQMLVITIRLSICRQIMQLSMRSMDLLLCQFLILLRCHVVLCWNLSLPKRSPILMQSWKLFAMHSRLVSLFLSFTARIFF